MFRLDHSTLDRSKGSPPLGTQLADYLRRAITGKPPELPPGEALPSEDKMANMLGVSRPVVRHALSELDREGLLIKRAGMPTRVAPRSPVRIMDARRYRRWLDPLRAGKVMPDASAFTQDHGAAWDEFTIDPCEFAESTASPVEARALKIQVGDRVLRRMMVKRLRGQPLELVWSVLPWEIVDGTRMLIASLQPVPAGTCAELFYAGYDPELARHKVQGRPPDAKERSLLQMQTADWVWETERVFLSGGKPVEASWTIAPVSQNVLSFEVDLRS